MTDIQKEELRIMIEFDRICRKHNLKYSLSYGTLLGAIRHKGFIPWDDDIDVIMMRDEYNTFKDIVDSELPEDIKFRDNDVESKYYTGFAKLRSTTLDNPEISSNYLGIDQGVWVDILPLDAVPNDKVLSDKQKDTVKKYHKRLIMSVYITPKEGASTLLNLVRNTIYFINRKTQNMTCFRQRYYDKMVEASTKYNGNKNVKYNALTANLTDHEFYEGLISKDEMIDLIDVEFEGCKFMAIRSYDKNLTGNYGDYMTPPPVEEQVSHHSM